jgi:thiol:disulfide interchange protein
MRAFPTGALAAAALVVGLTAGAARGQVPVRWRRPVAPLKGPAPTGQAVTLSAAEHGAISFDDVQYPSGERLEVDRAVFTDLAPDQAWNSVYHDEAVLYLSGRVSDQAAPGETNVELSLRGQVCDKSCILYQGSFEVPLRIAEAGSDSHEQHAAIFASFQQPSKAGSAEKPHGDDPGNPPAPVPFAIPRAENQLRATVYINRHPLRPGDDFLIAVRLEVEPGWHVTANPKGPGIGRELQLVPSEQAGLTFAPARYPKGERFEQAGDWTWVYGDKATLYLPGTVSDDAAPGPIEVALQLVGQVCNDQQCIPFSKGSASLPLAVGETGTPSQMLNEQIFAGFAAGSEARPAATAQETTAEQAATAPAAGEGFWGYLITCFGVGFLAALTPCFYPMIPVTVTFFLKQGEQKGASPLILAGVYSLTIVASFTVAGLVFGAALGQLGANPYLNLVFAVVLVVFGMALVGMFDIPIPQGMARWSSKGEAKGGLVGVMFMALTLLIVGTPCIAPFWGPVLVGGAGISGMSVGPVNLVLALGALSFSLALAIPFFGFALTPGLLGRLPKSGDWMTTIKVVMGFVLIGVAFKYLGSALTTWGMSMLDRNTVLCVWAAICLVNGLYLLGLLRTTHDGPNEGVSGARLLSGTGFLACTLYFTIGVFQFLPGSLEVFLPAGSPIVAAGASSSGENELTWYDTTFDQALAKAREENRPLFVDFTGINCGNCKVMERTIFPQPSVTERFEKMTLAKLYTDRQTEPHQSNDAKNIDLLYKRFQSPGPPFYAIIRPDGADGEVLGTFAGLTTSESEFVAFIDKALARWEQAQATPSTATVGMASRTFEVVSAEHESQH